MGVFCVLAFRSYNEALICLTADLSMMEVRQRSSPHAPDDKRFSTMIHHMFFAIVHHFRDNKAQSIAPLATLLEAAIAAKTVSLAPSAVLSEIDSFADRYILLRTCAIFEHCFSTDTLSHDWDAELEWERLAERYGVRPDTEPPALPRFTFSGLADKFIDFFKPPNGVNIAAQNSVWLSLLTGDRVVFHEDPDPGELTRAEFSRKMLGTYAPMIVLCGPKANMTLYWSMQWSKLYDEAIESLYVDRFGDPDIGLRRGGILSLSADAVDREIDRVLSHAWADHVV
jgi:hypothetical protein